MANEQRKNVTLYKNPENSLNNITVVMASSATDEAIVRLTFRTRREAYTSETGTEDQIRDKLAEIIETRLQNEGVELGKTRLESGYIVLTAQRGSANGGAKIFKEAEAVMNSVSKLASQGVSLKAALEQVLEAEQAVQAGSPRKDVKAELALTPDRAKAVILKIFTDAKHILPANEAEAFSTKLGTQIASQFPTRPPINGDPVQNRGTANDPLYDMIDKACEAIPEEKGKRKYVTGEIFDKIAEAYEGLGKAPPLKAARAR